MVEAERGCQVEWEERSVCVVCCKLCEVEVIQGGWLTCHQVLHMRDMVVDKDRVLGHLE